MKSATTRRVILILWNKILINMAILIHMVNDIQSAFVCETIGSTTYESEQRMILGQVLKQLM